MSPKCDAIAVLVVRLENHQPDDSGLCWHSWEKSLGKTPNGLPENGERRSTREQPFKRLPLPSTWHYFNEHVGRLLFPPKDEPGGHWLCCPDNLCLEFREEPDEPVRRARVDLLERIATPLKPQHTIGLVHLSLLPTNEQDAPDTLQWGHGVSSTFRRAYERFELTLTGEGRVVELSDGRPVRALVDALFGDPHPSLEQHFYTVHMAQCPDELQADPEGQGEWRRALAQHRAQMWPRAQDDSEEKRAARQTLRIGGGISALVLGRGTAFSLEEPITGSHARNFRSYWTESIVLGLLQQYALEEFQGRLAEFGASLSPGIGGLRKDWLKFRNVLWWSQLSTSAEIPQELVVRLRNEQGTERLFSDLEGDLATYTEHQHQEALANLQVWGSAIAVFGPLATIIGLASVSGRLLWILLGASIVVALGALFTVRAQLKGRTRRNRQT